MSDIERLKHLMSQAIDRGRDQSIGIAETVLKCPETGFREVRTSALVQDAFRTLGIAFTPGIAGTGIKAVLSGAGAGPAVAVMGELDSVICPGHPHADPGTGAAHACGHHAQLGMLVAVGQAVSAAGVMDRLAGRVVLMAVPAEEFIEIEARLAMRQEGKIEFLGGKPEMVRLGAFDDVDLAMMTHTSTDSKVKGLAVGATFNGMVAKEAEFIGRAAHAGACPWEGINALNAATLAISAIHANRETFREEDTVRVHPIVTRGGDVVNVVPARARIEMFVRGGTLTSIEDTCRKVDRSLKAGAMAVGAKVRIRTLPGYLPMERHDPFNALYRENAEALVGKDRVTVYGHCAASTDMSDITQIMPAIHPYADGVAGVVHGKDYLVRDWDAAVLTPAKAMAFTLVDLLADGARRGKEILAACPPKLTKPQYLRLLRSYLNEEEFE